MTSKPPQSRNPHSTPSRHPPGPRAPFRPPQSKDGPPARPAAHPAATPPVLPDWRIGRPTEPLPPTEEFLKAAGDLGVRFEEGDVQKLGLYLALLLHANKAFNLTGVEEPPQAWMRHILDSLMLLAVLAELPAGSKVIDVGSGGGLPGLPLAIVLPELRFTLLEATGKKAEFLKQAVHWLDLKNVDVLAERAEHAARFVGAQSRADGVVAHREAYDAVVARAVGRLAVVAELTVPFAKVGGRVYLIKGQKADEEVAEGMQALYLLHAHHIGTVDTPTGRIVVIEKTRPTPRSYPRRDGEPKRSPLGVQADKKKIQHRDTEAPRRAGAGGEDLDSGGAKVP
jgi:16S rRNA (guanine527-N7)-methyltransferase